MSMWSEDKLDILVQEAICCDCSFRSKCHLTSEEHTSHVFARLMWQGKVQVAVQWLIERFKGSVVLPDDEILSSDGSTTSVMDTLKSKHPKTHLPHSSTLLNPTHLPLLEDIEVTEVHISLIAHTTHGSAGPCGCDSSHWQDALLQFGNHSRKLCDSIVTLTRHISNSLVDWYMIKALLSNRLIALDKCVQLELVRPCVGLFAKQSGA